MKSVELEDLYAILTAGGRNGNEITHAQPKRNYRDPAEAVQFPAERERNRKAREQKRLERMKSKRSG